MNEVGIADTPDKIKRTTTVNREGKFDFNRTEKGKIYNVIIEKKHFCWIKESIKSKIEGDSKIDNVSFQHIGYRVTYDADFAFQLETAKNGSPSTVDVAEGEGQFCLREAGQWKLTPKSGCALFTEEEAIIETDEENHLNFRASHVKVSGFIVHHKDEKIHISELSVQVSGENAILKRKNDHTVNYSVYLPVEKQH